MNQDKLTEIVREAFRYHAPGWIDYGRIIVFAQWAESIELTEEQISPSIGELLKSGYIVKANTGWQIASAAKTFRSSINT